MLLVVALNFGDSGGLSVLLVWDMIVAAVGYCVYSRLPPGGGCVFRQGLGLVSRMVACPVIAGLQVGLLGVQCVALGVSLWPGGLFFKPLHSPSHTGRHCVWAVGGRHFGAQAGLHHRRRVWQTPCQAARFGSSAYAPATHQLWSAVFLKRGWDCVVGLRLFSLCGAAQLGLWGLAQGRVCMTWPLGPGVRGLAQRTQANASWV